MGCSQVCENDSIADMQILPLDFAGFSARSFTDAVGRSVNRFLISHLTEYKAKNLR